MAKVLVTGGAGFIGSNIVEALLKRGDQVRVLDNFSTGRRSNLEPFLGAGMGKGTGEGIGKGEGKGKDREVDLSTPTFASTSTFELVEGDIRSPFTVMEAMQGVDYVLHQAALPSVPRSVKDPLTTNEVNVVGTLNVLRAALACKVKRVVYASSSSVYGNSEELPKHEGMIPSPMSPYAVSKLAGENYCHVFSRLYGLEAVALRYFNVFGPRQDPTSQYAAVIPKFIAAIREGRQPVVYGDGEQSRDFTPVANVVAANLAACTVPLGGKVEAKVESGDPSISTSTFSAPAGAQPTSTFLLSNVAVGERYTLNFLVNEICRVVGKRVKPIYEPPRPGDVKHSLASVEILRGKLGLSNPVSFLVGLESLVRREVSAR